MKKNKELSRKELLASGAAMLGASLTAGVGASANAAAMSTAAAKTASIQLKGTGAQLQAQAASAQDPVKGAILKAAAEQIRNAGGDKADFDLSFGLSWRGAQAATTR